MQSVPLCKRPDCRRVLAVLPGRWEVVRAVAERERVPEGSGVLVCHVDRDQVGRVRSGCGARYEVRLEPAGMEVV